MCVWVVDGRFCRPGEVRTSVTSNSIEKSEENCCSNERKIGLTIVRHSMLILMGQFRDFNSRACGKYVQFFFVNIASSYRLFVLNIHFIVTLIRWMNRIQIGFYTHLGLIYKYHGLQAFAVVLSTWANERRECFNHTAVAHRYIHTVWRMYRVNFEKIIFKLSVPFEITHKSTLIVYAIFIHLRTQ